MEFNGNRWFHKQTHPQSLKKLISKFKKVVKEKTGNTFDYIACQGVSGAFIASPLSLSINKPCLLTKKPTEKSHRTVDVIGHLDYTKDFNTYIIVDDVIATGGTIENIMNLIHLEFNGRAKCVGIFLHEDFLGSWSLFKQCPIYYVDRSVELDVYRRTPSNPIESK